MFRSAIQCLSDLLESIQRLLGAPLRIRCHCLLTIRCDLERTISTAQVSFLLTPWSFPNRTGWQPCPEDRKSSQASHLRRDADHEFERTSRSVAWYLCFFWCIAYDNAGDVRISDSYVYGIQELVAAPPLEILDFRDEIRRLNEKLESYQRDKVQQGSLVKRLRNEVHSLRYRVCRCISFVFVRF